VCIKKVREFNPTQLANVIWAFASMHHRDAELYRLLAKVAYKQVYTFKPPSLAMVAWSFAEVGQYNEPFHSAAVPLLLKNLDALPPAAVAQTAAAVAAFTPDNRAALDRIAETASAGAAAYEQGEWQQLVDAFAAAKHPEAAKLHALRPPQQQQQPLRSTAELPAAVAAAGHA
jgi:hypothetical protein